MIILITVKFVQRVSSHNKWITFIDDISMGNNIGLGIVK